MAVGTDLTHPASAGSPAVGGVGGGSPAVDGDAALPTTESVIREAALGRPPHPPIRRCTSQLSNLPHSDTAIPVKESIRMMSEALGRHSLALGVIGVGLASAVWVSLHIQNIKNDMKIQEERIKTLVFTQEERTKTLVEMAKRETAERFLMYGYAEEFQRYQQKLGLRPQDRPDK